MQHGKCVVEGKPILCCIIQVKGDFTSCPYNFVQDSNVQCLCAIRFALVIVGGKAEAEQCVEQGCQEG